ncbi:MAG: hypothetical protein PHV30_04995 [Candidatus Margulisbacteria bacterium]|nr:hypothetical protein [Candidatus Margulisiibacteriota bacterium]
MASPVNKQLNGVMTGRDNCEKLQKLNPKALKEFVDLVCGFEGMNDYINQQKYLLNGKEYQLPAKDRIDVHSVRFVGEGKDRNVEYKIKCLPEELMGFLEIGYLLRGVLLEKGYQQEAISIKETEVNNEYLVKIQLGKKPTPKPDLFVQYVNGHKYKIYNVEYAGNNVFIGDNHANIEQQNFKRDLISEAVNKKLVVFIELTRDEDMEKYMAKKLVGKTDSGYLYGMDDYYARTFSMYALGYNTLSDSQNPNQERFKEKMIIDCVRDHSLAGIWEMITGKMGKIVPLAASIPEAIKSAKTLKDVLDTIKNNPNYQDNLQWLKICRFILEAMKGKVISMGANRKLIDDFLDNPQKMFSTFYEQININFRNEYMAQNIKAVMSKFPADKKYTVIVGLDHLQNLFQLLCRLSQPL